MAVGMFLSCGNTDKEIVEASIDPDAPTEISKGVTMMFSDKGIAKMKLESPLMYRFEMEEDEMKLECPNGMKVTFFDSIGNLDAVLIANYGLLLSKKEYIEVRDSVVFENVKNEKLETNLLYIDLKKDTAYTDKQVRVTTPKGTVTGQGFGSKSNFSKYKVYKISNGEMEFEKEVVNSNNN